MLEGAASAAVAAEGLGEIPGPIKETIERDFTKIADYHRPPHYPKQLEAIFNPVDKAGNPARYSFIEASTKAGKTRGCICWLAEQAILGGRPGRNYWWVAPVHPQADIAYKRMKRAFPKWMVVKTNDTDKVIVLLNGATIWFKSGEKPDNLYGEDVYAVVIDEGSRCRKEVWHAIRSTLTFTQGPVRVIGNVKGRKNWFYELARKAEHGEAGYAHYKMTAYDAVEGGLFPMAEVEQARRDLPDHIFRELYLAEPSDDGGNPFGLSHIRGCIAPMTDEAPFACGVDFAKSVDWSVVHALDRNGDTCGHDRWQSPWELTTPRVIGLIGQVPTLADETGVGSPIVEKLIAANPRCEGVIFTAATKQPLMVGLASAIQSREVTFPPGVIVDELECFEYEYTRTGVRYSAPEGYHDDCVIALALAVEQRRRLNPSIRGTGPGGPVGVSPWLDGSEPDDEGGGDGEFDGLV
jgi:hypothetical protein